ncbi:sulfatase-like hydrolase/transferase, partial [Akkermansiaceae bacterium]|nr:sulfatase-like hydrolase/transferase [Akkermansiaceae bacterium]
NIPTTTKKGVDFINAQASAEKPFFLFFAYPAPHAPIIPNDQFDGKSKAGPYGDLVYETDDSIGQILKALKESGQEEDTLVIFTADNGPEHYAYARDEKFDHWSAHPFRGLKRDIFEGGHHVPFIVKYPGVTKPGSVSDQLVSQIDIMATVASITGYKLPSQNAAEDSHDLLPLLKGGTEVVRSSHIHNTNKNSYAIRDGDWVLVAAKSGYHSGQYKGWEKKREYEPQSKNSKLYNLKEDIGQRNDLAAKHPEKVKQMTELLTKLRKQGYSAPRLDK